jgi:hypothetical protein
MDPAFLWSGTSSMTLDLDQMECVEVQQEILFFSQGTYDVSRLQVTLDQRTFYSSDQEQVFVYVV